MRLDTAPADAPGNRLDGFLGNIVDYQIDAGGLVLRVQADRHVVREVGSRVRLTIPIEECVAMPTPPDAGISVMRA